MTTYRGKGFTVEATMTLNEAAVACSKLPGDFPRDLARKALMGRRLSEAQLAWLFRMAQEGPRKAETANVGDMTGTVALFQTAKARVKWPRVRLAVDGLPVVLSMAGPKSKYAGQINVTDGGRFGDNVWYGRIDLTGTYTKGRAATDAVTALLTRFAADPAGVAAEQGRLSGFCCFCGLQLTDDRSLAMGYGPVCADKFGLPWGTEKFNTKEAAMELSAAS
jgi:uncharacterized protein DUF6011